MRKIPRLFILFLASTFLTLGCASTVLTLEQPNGFDREITKTHHIALWGFWEISDPVRPDQICGTAQWTKISTQFGLVGVAAGILTSGLYTPATVVVSCRDFQSQR